MTSWGLFEAKLKAFEIRMDAKLCALFEEFRLDQSPSPRRSQHRANSDCEKNLSEIRSEDKTRQPYTSTTSTSFAQLQEGHLNQNAQSMRATSQPIAYKPSAPIDFKYHDKELMMIHQTFTIQEYQTMFKRLSNQTYVCSEKQILRTFIEGLKPEIREEVKARQPYTLKAAISFARHQEERLNYEAQRMRVVTPQPAALKLSPPPTISRSPQPKKLIREDFHDGSTKEPKLEHMILKLKEKDTPQPATHTVPTLANYTNLQKLKIERFLEQ
ncbi:hypothetical protein BHM03_00009578 [Ensete ventricosum]|nr:hypothetical protein BHM03_00009578 [Ensete ventricosum]